MSYARITCECGKLFSLFLLLGQILLPLKADAGTPLAKQQIEHVVTQAITSELALWQQRQDIQDLTHRIEIKLPSVTSHLTPCPNTLQVSQAKGLPFGRVQRRVSCEKLNWGLYVRAQVTVKAKLPVLIQQAKRGEVITGSMLGWRTLTLQTRDKDALTTRAEILGQQVTRKIDKNRPIRANQLEAPLLVKRGEPVIIEAKSSGFSARVQGIALGSGKKGEAVKVKNSQSGNIIIAFPVAKGRVETRF